MSNGLFGRAAQVGLWLLLAVFFGLLTYGQMLHMSSVIRGGWQMRDLGQLTGVLVCGLLTFLTARKARSAWVSNAAVNDSNGGWRFGAAVAIVMVLLGTVAILALGYFGRSQSGDPGAGSSAAVKSATEIQTRVLRAPRGDFTEDDITPEKAEELRGQLASQYLAGVVDAAAEAGHDTASLNLKVESDAEIGEFKGRRIMIIRMAVPGVNRAITALGVVGDELVQVTCIGHSVAAVSLDGPACRRQLGEVFP